MCKKNDFCYLDIKSGLGGNESKDWIKILYKMYVGWSNIKKLNIKVIYISDNYINLKIIGKKSYELFKKETGVHKLIRKNPLNSNKRHTTLASVNVYIKNIENKINIIKKKYLKIDTFKSSGSGGQHVNKTNSAVRIKHLPTGIIIKCNSNRNQHKNKKEAMFKLIKKINNLKTNKEKINKKNEHLIKLDKKWNNHIRSYIFDKSLIIDVKTGIKIKNIKKILNGDLSVFNK